MAPIAGGASPFSITLHITGAARELQTLRLDPSSIRIVDDTGASLLALKNVNSLLPVRFLGGVGYVIPIHRPAEGATLLRTVAGTILVQDAKRTAQYPFVLRDLALPSAAKPRVYGRMVPRKIPLEEQTRLPDGLVVLQDESAKRVIASSEPAFVGPEQAPQRLIMAPGVPAKVRLPNPSGSEPIEMLTAIAPMGRIDLSIRYRGESWNGSTWEYESLCLVLPRSGAGKRLAAAIRLSRNSSVTPGSEISPPTFLPDQGEPGGAIVSRALVGDRPFGRGQLQVEVRHLDNGVWSAPRVVNVPIQQDGAVELTNLAPGAYSVRRVGSTASPFLPEGEPAAVQSAYLHSRFGVSRGRWVGESVESIQVRPGERAEIPPLRFVPFSALSETIFKSR
jgi:hypothetical protein